METTCIKLHEDISGDVVTVDFESLVYVARLAAGRAAHDILSAADRAVHNMMDDDIFHAERESETLERATSQYCKAIRTLHILTALQEPDNQREKLRIYGITQEAVTLTSTYEDK